MRSIRFHLMLGIGTLLACIMLVAVPLTVSAQELGPVSDEGLAEEPTGGIGLDAVGCTRTNTPPINTVFEQRVVELVNIERAKVGNPPLKRNSELDYAARDHTRDMVEDNYFNHDTYDRINGVESWVCGAFTRIRLYYSGYSLAGENLGAGYSTPEGVVQGWMASPLHKENMLKAGYKEIGVGYYYGGSSFMHYWAQDFGAKPDVFPVVINNEAPTTTTSTVGLFAYGKDVWAEMRTRDNGGNWTNWVPFQEKVTVQLTPTNGTHTLSVEMRAAGAVNAGAVSSDTIELTNMPVPEYNNKIFLPFVKR